MRRDIAPEDMLRDVDADWDRVSVEVGLRRLHLALDGRRKRRIAGAALLATAGVVAAVLLLLRDTDVGGGRFQPVQFVDGSTMTPIRVGTQVAVTEVTSERISVALLRGSARFDVRPDSQRRFHVAVGDVSVTVIGTEFEVVRRRGEVGVHVTRGVVSVSSARRHELLLRAGQQMRFSIANEHPVSRSSTPVKPPPAPLEPAQPTPGHQASTSDAVRDTEVRDTTGLERPQDEPPVAEATTEDPSPRDESRRADWRRQARRGDYQAAYQSLARIGRTGVRDRAEELLLAADAARLSGHQREALPFLARVIANHADDPRAALAAFTEGNIRMRNLGEPRRAAQAFARARELDPHGSLAEDALAREVEAWHRAGRAAQARAAARRYLDTYPDGRRQRAVRRFGGLE